MASSARALERHVVDLDRILNARWALASAAAISASVVPARRLVQKGRNPSALESRVDTLSATTGSSARPSSNWRQQLSGRPSATEPCHRVRNVRIG